VDGCGVGRVGSAEVLAGEARDGDTFVRGRERAREREGLETDGESE